MTAISIQSIGLITTGLQGWLESREVLAGKKPWTMKSIELAAITSLPANERRRVGRLSKLAINAILDALGNDNKSETNYASIFSSSCGDLNVVDNICMSLCQEDGVVSPTQFHNSVHNAQAGYWAISEHIQKASNSICAYTGSFAAGLLEAYSYLLAEQQSVMLVAYDSPGPDLIKQFSPTQSECAVAMLLSPWQDDHSQAQIKLTCQAFNQGDSLTSVCESEALEVLRLGCPAARAMPLLEGLARYQQGEVILPYIDHLNVRVEWTQ